MLKSQKKNSHTKAEKIKFVTSENAGTKQWNRLDRRSVQRQRWGTQSLRMY